MEGKQTIEQQRATAAWKCIDEVNRLSEKFKKRYSGLVRSFPALVQTSGLGQALAFLRAKSNASNEHGLLYSHLSGWVVGRMSFAGSSRDLLQGIMSSDSQIYRRATVEALAYAIWLKRFAEAELPEPDGTEDGAGKGGVS